MAFANKREEEEALWQSEVDEQRRYHSRVAAERRLQIAEAAREEVRRRHQAEMDERIMREIEANNLRQQQEWAARQEQLHPLLREPFRPAPVVPQPVFEAARRFPKDGQRAYQAA